MAAKRKSQGKVSTDEPYELYLMRHGIAAELDASSAFDDAKRPLTAEGKLRLRATAKGLGRIGIELDWIVTSTLQRAVETGAIIKESLAPAAAMDECEALTPGSFAPDKIVSFLSHHPDRAHTLLVGHEPSLSELASELIGADDANLGFKKGGCCLISFEEFPLKPPGLLSWWLTPRILRKLGS